MLHVSNGTRLPTDFLLQYWYTVKQASTCTCRIPTSMQQPRSIKVVNKLAASRLIRYTAAVDEQQEDARLAAYADAWCSARTTAFELQLCCYILRVRPVCCLACWSDLKLGNPNLLQSLQKSLNHGWSFPVSFLWKVTGFGQPCLSLPQ